MHIFQSQGQARAATPEAKVLSPPPRSVKKTATPAPWAALTQNKVGVNPVVHFSSPPCPLSPLL